MLKILVIAIFAAVSGTAKGQNEILTNADMELDFSGNWKCRGSCTLEHSNDSLTGAKSAKVTNRDKVWAGVSQGVDLQAGLRYRISGSLKLLNTVNNSMYHDAELRTDCKNSQGKKSSVKFGRDIKVQPHIWTELGAVRKLPEGYDTDCIVYIQVGALTDYVADNFTVKKIPDLTNWRAEANARIENLRKANFSIRVKSNYGIPDNLEMEVKQTSHGFPFGCAVNPEMIVASDPVSVRYQAFFYDLFNWGMPTNSLKWKQTEKVQGEFDVSLGYNAIQALRSKGIKIRGHSVFFAHEKSQPEWVKSLNASQLKQAIDQRIDDLIGNLTGLVEYWVVNNENTHGDFYETNTGDANITEKMFRGINAKDPNAKLYLNDYEIIETRNSQKAWIITQQAKMLKAAGAPIDSIAMQSHIKSANLDPTSMKMRLDKVAESGLPIWISEFSMEEWNETKKALALEDALTLFYSHPAVAGIVIWGYYNGSIFAQSASLVEGPDMIPNAAGNALKKLLKETWMTQETRTVVNTEKMYFRGFNGDYTVSLKLNGTVLKTKDFTVNGPGKSLSIRYNE